MHRRPRHPRSRPASVAERPPPAEQDALGLYVHIPFCEVKCTYCHFAIDPHRPGEERQEPMLLSNEVFEVFE